LLSLFIRAVAGWPGGPHPTPPGPAGQGKEKRRWVGQGECVAMAWPNEWNVHEEAVPRFVGPRRDQLDL